mmetsp:Transcript_69950/g.221628  ORF Transcript_69950/g.221628 Transcript_69950/m.221628 type:complete len:230 (-) Transcript_69950:199-888(-)
MVRSWIVAAVLALAVALPLAAGADVPPPKLPKQFSATVTITAHRVDRSKEYPPRIRVMQVLYDQINGRFRTDYEVTKRTAIKRYDQSKEFLVSRVDGKADCRISKIKGGQQMPLPEWPATAEFVGKEQLGKVDVHHWRDEQGAVVVDIFVDAVSGALVQVAVETVEQTEPVRMTRPDITYEVTAFRAGEPAEGEFSLPGDVEGGEGACERQPNDIGFPYTHFFHYFYRA